MGRTAGGQPLPAVILLAGYYYSYNYNYTATMYATPGQVAASGDGPRDGRTGKSKDAVSSTGLAERQRGGLKPPGRDQKGRVTGVAQPNSERPAHLLTSLPLVSLPGPSPIRTDFRLAFFGRVPSPGSYAVPRCHQSRLSVCIISLAAIICQSMRHLPSALFHVAHPMPVPLKPLSIPSRPPFLPGLLDARVPLGNQPGCCTGTKTREGLDLIHFDGPLHMPRSQSRLLLAVPRVASPSPT